MQQIEVGDLRHLSEIARQDRGQFLIAHPDFAIYADRLIAVALCQGAALHFIDGRNGIKDFDVWSFYAEHPARRINPRPRVSRDFGASRFGRHPDDNGYEGRRVDLLMRGLKCEPNANPVEVLRHYLTARQTTSAAYLAQKAVVLLEPTDLLGAVVWQEAS